MRTPSPALEAFLDSTVPASGIVGSFRSRSVSLYREWAGPTSGLWRRGLGLLRRGAARMLGAPRAHLGAVEGAVVIGVHLVAACPGPFRCPVLCASGDLIPPDAAGAGRSGSRGV